MRGGEAVHLKGRGRSPFGGRHSDRKLPPEIHRHLLTVSLQRNTRNQYIKNYCFQFDFGHPWGLCEVTMTAVVGHLTSVNFEPGYKNWKHPPPVTLFNARIVTSIADVGCAALAWPGLALC